MSGFIRHGGVLVVLILGVGGALAGQAAKPTEPPPSVDPSERIGVYDSRAVACAFAGSKKHETIIAGWKKEFEAAEAAKDTKTMQEIKARARAAQAKMHRQGFGTAPVEDILALYPEEVEKLKRDHRLAALVSKWDSVTLGKYPKAKRIDVTDEMIEIPGPGERQRKVAREIQTKKPVAAWKIAILDNPIYLVWLAVAALVLVTLLVTAIVLVWRKKRKRARAAS